MLIGAIIFTALLLTLIVHHILSLRSQSIHSFQSSLPQQSPFAIFLTFFNCLLFSATVGMILHEPLMAQKRANLFETFAGAQPAPTGFYPETSISLIYPEPSIFPSSRKNEVVSSPTPKPIVENNQKSALPALQDGTAIANDKIIAIWVKGKIKGYTSEYLSSISLLRDFHGGSRIMLMVKDDRVAFYNKDNGEKKNAQSIERNMWNEIYPDAELQELIIEEPETYQPLL